MLIKLSEEHKTQDMKNFEREESVTYHRCVKILTVLGLQLLYVLPQPPDALPVAVLSFVASHAQEGPYMTLGRGALQSSPHLSYPH
jgi:hypothetical protein